MYSYGGVSFVMVPHPSPQLHKSGSFSSPPPQKVMCHDHKIHTCKVNICKDARQKSIDICLVEILSTSMESLQWSNQVHATAFKHQASSSKQASGIKQYYQLSDHQLFQSLIIPIINYSIINYSNPPSFNPIHSSPFLHHATMDYSICGCLNLCYSNKPNHRARKKVKEPSMVTCCCARRMELITKDN